MHIIQSLVTSDSYVSINIIKLFLTRGCVALCPQTCLSEVRGPLVDLGVSEYGILSAITTLSETQNDLDLNHQHSSSCSEPRYSADDITLFRQIALDLREFRQNNKFRGLASEC